MSAYITSDETINTIIAFIKSDSSRNAHIYRPLENKGFVWDSYEARLALGKAMRDLNIQGVCARYDDDKVEILVGEDTYEYTSGFMPSRIEAYKNLQCWLYQCCEGDVPETDLFKAFESVQAQMAMHIVGRLPEYDKAGWGA